MQITSHTGMQCPVVGHTSALHIMPARHPLPGCDVRPNKLTTPAATLLTPVAAARAQISTRSEARML